MKELKYIIGAARCWAARINLFCKIVWRIWEPGYRISWGIAWGIARDIVDYDWYTNGPQRRAREEAWAMRDSSNLIVGPARPDLQK